MSLSSVNGPPHQKQRSGSISVASRSSSVKSTRSQPGQAYVRPTRPVQSLSDYDPNQHRITIHTIEEDFAVASADDTRHSGGQGKIRLDRRSYGNTTGSDGSSSVAHPVSTKSSRYAASRQSDNSGAGSGNVPTTSVPPPPRRPRPGHDWSRTMSGGVWYQKLRTSPGTQQSSSRSHHTSSDIERSIPKKLLIPLTPPKLQGVAGRPVPIRHEINIETPFPSITVPNETHVTIIEPPVGRSSRRSSIDPRRIFSNPLDLFHRLRNPKRNQDLPETHTQSLIDFLGDGARKSELADHITLLKRNHTAEALRRVTSILREGVTKIGSTKPSSLTTPGTLLSYKSSLSRDSNNVTQTRTEVRKTIFAPTTLYNTVSLEDLVETASHTSSQQEIRFGLEPNNTPEERATYKIKRSASADTEEFLKVDISIRGGTSYLPSEARRIHTPPTPREGPDGRRRGFFFDYNAPHDQDTVDDRVKELGATPSCAKSPVRSSGRTPIPDRSTSRATTISRPRRTQKSKRSKRVGKVDWYDAKLEELDSDNDEEEISSENTTRERSPSAVSSISEVRRQKMLQQFDLSIPEHLPNSPLCPRHPKYWRVVQNRGNQFRGCYMHGIGVDERWTNMSK